MRWKPAAAEGGRCRGGRGQMLDRGTELAAAGQRGGPARGGGPRPAWRSSAVNATSGVNEPGAGLCRAGQQGSLGRFRRKHRGQAPSASGALEDRGAGARGGLPSGYYRGSMLSGVPSTLPISRGCSPRKRTHSKSGRGPIARERQPEGAPGKASVSRGSLN